MAITTAKQRNIKISAQKAGLVCDMIRGKNIQTALQILETTDKKIAPIILKLLKSAIANATNNHAMDANRLIIKTILANQGPSQKRILMRAKGSADSIKKRTTHLEITLSDQSELSQNKIEKTNNSKKIVQETIHETVINKEPAIENKEGVK